MIDIEVYRSDLFYIRETAKQIIKDFDVFNIEVTFSGRPETAYDELKHQLTTALSALLKTEISKVLSILYRIDVMEKKIKKAFLPEYSERRAELLSDLIIERELQKVVVRKMLSDGNSL